MIRLNPAHLPKTDIKVLVSGGVDSIAAAYWLWNNYRLDFTVVHFNHEVQPLNFQMWQAVKNLCEYMGVNCISRHRTHCDNIFDDLSEKGMREWRLHEMEKIGGNFITAHHLNDCVEQYLMNCFKGCPEHAPMNFLTKFPSFNVYHPFLKCTKQDLAIFAWENNLMDFVVEDPTNKDTSIRRNWLRNIMIPMLRMNDVHLEKVVVKKLKQYGKET